jgi:hypothetical protein
MLSFKERIKIAVERASPARAWAGEGVAEKMDRPAAAQVVIEAPKTRREMA